MELLEQMLGRELGLPVRFAIAFVFVLILIVITAWVVRRIADRRIGGGGRGRQQRLSVVDHAIVDARRRLVLVRRDHLEHLLLIGGPTDVVIETGVIRPGSVAGQPTRQEAAYQAQIAQAAQAAPDMAPPPVPEPVQVGMQPPPGAAPAAMPQPAAAPPQRPYGTASQPARPAPQPPQAGQTMPQPPQAAPPAPAQPMPPAGPADMAAGQPPQQPSQAAPAPRPGMPQPSRLTSRPPQWGSERGTGGNPFSRFQPGQRPGAGATAATTGATAGSAASAGWGAPPAPPAADQAAAQKPGPDGSGPTGDTRPGDAASADKGTDEAGVDGKTALVSEDAFIPELDFLGGEAPAQPAPAASENGEDGDGDPQRSNFLNQIGSRKT